MSDMNLLKFKKGKCQVLPMYHARLGPNCCKTAWQKRPRRSWKAPSWHQLAMCSWSKEIQQCPWVHREEHCQHIKWDDPFPLVFPDEMWLECWVHIWAPLCKWVHCRGSSKMPQRWLRVWSIWHRRRGWDSWGCSAQRWEGCKRSLCVNRDELS